MTDLFAHGIGRADLFNGMVRLELVTLAPGPDGAATSQPSQALWLPLDGFLRSVATIEGLMGELAKAGVIRPPPRAGAGTPAPAPASPNFPSE